MIRKYVKFTRCAMGFSVVLSGFITILLYFQLRLGNKSEAFFRDVIVAGSFILIFTISMLILVGIRELIDKREIKTKSYF